MIAFQPLTSDSLGSAYRLSTQAGWNQTTEDWRRLMNLKSGIACVWNDLGETRASYSLSGYGETAWIGMILVDEAYRGAGLGKAAFHAALHHANSLGFKTLGLDATALGEPIYTKEGFQTIRPIVRWEGIFTSAGSVTDTPKVQECLNSQVLALDGDVTGLDRSDLLTNFASTGTVLHQTENGNTVGYAMWRPGRMAIHLGPVLARSVTNFASLLNAASADLHGENVICDALSPDIAPILEAHGLRPRRHLQRMTKPRAKDCLCPVAIRCGAGFEFG